MKVPRGARCPVHGPQTEAVALRVGDVLVRYCPVEGCGERLEGAPDLVPYGRAKVNTNRGSRERRRIYRG